MSRNKVGCTNGFKGDYGGHGQPQTPTEKMHYQTRYLATKHVNAFAAGALLHAVHIQGAYSTIQTP